MKKRKNITSATQLARVRAWEATHPEQAQARKDAWAQSPKGKAWLAKNQKKKNMARDKWRAARDTQSKPRGFIFRGTQPNMVIFARPSTPQWTMRADSMTDSPNNRNLPADEK